MGWEDVDRSSRTGCDENEMFYQIHEAKWQRSLHRIISALSYTARRVNASTEYQTRIERYLRLEIVNT